MYPHNYQGILEVTLGPYRNTDSPGFGHIVWVITGMLAYCRAHNLYMHLIDDDWYYGKWARYLRPFWNEDEKQHVLSLGLPVKAINDTYGHGWGWEYVNTSAQLPTFLEVFQLNEETKACIQKDNDAFQDIDLAIHLRMNYELIPTTLQEYKDKISGIMNAYYINPEKIFILTDQKNSITFFEDFFQKKVLTLCPDFYDGIAANTRSPENLYLLLREIEIAKSAECFIGRHVSVVSRLLIGLQRNHKNCFLI